MSNQRSLRSLARTLASHGTRALALLLLVAAASGRAYADGPLPAPEIDPGSMAGALTLLTGGVLMLTDRVRGGRGR